MPKIYLDPGHGGSDAGAVYKGRRESDDTLRMALAVGKALEAQGASIKYSRQNDSEKLLMRRTEEANDWGADYFLSIHRNSFDGNATGNEIWIISSATDKTYSKAEKILNYVCSADKLANRGVKKGAPSYTDFAVNKYSKAASGLLELGFITNDKDNAAFDKHITDMAEQIAKALCEITGIAYKPKQPEPKPDDNDIDPATSADARKALRIAAKLETPTDEDFARLDKNKDGKINSEDARILLREAAKLDKEDS